LRFGVFDGLKQVGFARVRSDFATYAYLGDVFILEPYRGLGLAKSQLQGLRRWTLATHDAHQLYAQFGFKQLQHPERFTEMHEPGVYKKLDLT